MSPKRKPVVLYIDDDLANRKLIERIIARRCPQVRVVMAATAREGLGLVTTERPSLILLDRNLSSSSGDKVLQDLGVDPTTSEIPVVIVTGQHEGSSELVERGAKEVLLKPYDVDALEAIVTRYT
ncbi:MAG: response regulator [Actinomycetota bacterium]|nr:response regulator [Actinomycetota bacterium]